MSASMSAQSVPAAVHHRSVAAPTTPAEVLPSEELARYFTSWRRVQVNGVGLQVYENRPEGARDGTAPPTPTTLFVFHHGAGHSALSFALLVAYMRAHISRSVSPRSAEKPRARADDTRVGRAAGPTSGHVACEASPESANGNSQCDRELVAFMCFDARDHGASDSSGDLSIETLAKDTAAVVHAIYGSGDNEAIHASTAASSSGQPPAVAPSTGNSSRLASSLYPKEIVLVGHSLGGGVMVHVAQQKLIPNVIGTVVIDVVEGTAVESFVHMRGFLARRPHSFASYEDGAQYLLESNTIMNPQSAMVSVHGQLAPMHVEGSSGASTQGEQSTERRLVWRTNLYSSEPYWGGWFQDLSNKFLSVQGGRMLVLAGTDRLDKTLTIGQMQGKFQLVVLGECGHFVQEDIPERLGDVLYDFWRRNQPLRGIKRFEIPVRPRQGATRPIA